jgi:hypothetical protein
MMFIIRRNKRNNAKKEMIYMRKEMVEEIILGILTIVTFPIEN